LESKKSSYLLLAVATIAALVIGADRLCFSVFLKPITNELGLPREIIAGVFSINMFFYAIATPVAGYISDRIGFKKVIICGSIIASLGMFMASRAHTVEELYLYYGCIFGAGSSTLFTIPLAEVRKSFHRHSGFFMGVVSSATSLGIFISQPGADIFLRLYGWRGGFVIFSVIGLALLLLPASFLKRHKPAGNDESKDISVKDEIMAVLKRKEYWILTSAYSLFGMGQFLVLIHTLSFATDSGIDPTTAALIAGMIGAVGIPSRILIGLIVDKFGRRLLLTAFFVILGINFIIPIKDGLVTLWAFVIIFGIFYSGIISQFGGFTGDIFGLRVINSLFSIQSCLLGLFGAFGSFMGGFCYDMTGSYVYAFVFCSLCFLLSGFLVYIGSQPQREKDSLVVR